MDWKDDPHDDLGRSVLDSRMGPHLYDWADRMLEVVNFPWANSGDSEQAAFGHSEYPLRGR